MNNDDSANAMLFTGTGAFIVGIVTAGGVFGQGMMLWGAILFLIGMASKYKK